MLQFEALGFDCNIFHFVTTRQGTGGEDRYASFNLGYYCGDVRENVDRNRARLCEALSISPSDLHVPFQVHEDRIKVVDEDYLALDGDRQTGALAGFDALLTNIPGVCIAVTTADCVPLLFYAPAKRVVGVAHAGWRGTVKGIAAKTVKEMAGLYMLDPQDIYVGIGPSISKDAFEVGDEVVDAFRASGADISLICSNDSRTGKPHIDIAGANRLQLIEAGILESRIINSGICTFKEHDEFYSARRLGVNSGRFLTGIMLLK